MNKKIKLNEHGVEIRIDEDGNQILVAKGFCFNSSPNEQTPENEIWSDNEGNVHFTGNRVDLKS